MGLFNKFKELFKKDKQNTEEVKETEKYEKGLEKTRNEFVSKLSLLGIKYTKINDSFYDELEEILITADIGVNTVMDLSGINFSSGQIYFTATNSKDSMYGGNSLINFITPNVTINNMI